VDLIRPGGPVDQIDRVRCRERAVERFSRMRMVDEHIAMYEDVARKASVGRSARGTSSLIVA
jgi:hypothetical protein